MKLEVKMNIEEIMGSLDAIPMEPFIKKSMKRVGIETQKNVKEIINTFIGQKGHKQGVDTGSFRDSIHLMMFANGYAFRLADGVPYGIWHETGTKSHWVPFFDKSGNLTSLGQWAIRHFSDIGFKVVGKRGKALKRPSHDQRLEVLKKKRGMRVSLSKMQPFEKSLQHANKISPKVFEDTFSDIFAKGFEKEVNDG